MWKEVVEAFFESINPSICLEELRKPSSSKAGHRADRYETSVIRPNCQSLPSTFPQLICVICSDFYSRGDEFE